MNRWQCKDLTLRSNEISATRQARLFGKLDWTFLQVYSGWTKSECIYSDLKQRPRPDLLGSFSFKQLDGMSSCCPSLCSAAGTPLFPWPLPQKSESEDEALLLLMGSLVCLCLSPNPKPTSLSGDFWGASPDKNHQMSRWPWPSLLCKRVPVKYDLSVTAFWSLLWVSTGNQASSYNTKRFFDMIRLYLRQISQENIQVNNHLQSSMLRM